MLSDSNVLHAIYELAGRIANGAVLVGEIELCLRCYFQVLVRYTDMGSLTK